MTPFADHDSNRADKRGAGVAFLRNDHVGKNRHGSNAGMLKRWPPILAAAAAALVCAGLLVLAIQDFSSPVPIPLEQFEECQKATGEEHGKKLKCETSETRWHRTRDDPVSYYTLWLTAFTAILALVSVGQGVFLVRSDRTARMAAEAAKKSADAAIDSDRAILLLNPDIADLSYADNQSSELQKVYTTHCNVTNFGKTPAIIKSVQRAAEYRRSADPQIIERKFVPLSIEQIVPIGKSFELPMRLQIEADDLARAGRGEGVIYLLGAVQYEDIYGIPRETGFCVQYSAARATFVTVADKTLNYR